MQKELSQLNKENQRNLKVSQRNLKQAQEKEQLELAKTERIASKAQLDADTALEMTAIAEHTAAQPLVTAAAASATH